jgi:hypothetical protein
MAMVEPGADWSHSHRARAADPDLRVAGDSPQGLGGVGESAADQCGDAGGFPCHQAQSGWAARG